MSLSRFSAMDIVQNRMDDMLFANDGADAIASYFGDNVFTDAAMSKYLSEEDYLNIKKTLQSGKKITPELADVYAEGARNWASDKGVTHFAHWFQPWTGRSAEKHDSFFTLKPDGRVIEEFQGEVLCQQEPDSSSFPSGGMRSTATARGYTIWDPTSPLFIRDTAGAPTLCIPSAFVTYYGDAQDYKLPLLRSQSFLEKAALPIINLFDKQASRVTVTLGWEQEYFLIDEAFFNARPDLVMTGRALVGAVSARNQQLEDHYFGVIPERILAYMSDFERECHLLGIPVRTRHNEVAPAQFEVAPIFEEVNVGVDHNTLLMDVMESVARRHKLRCLLHEKPFAGINGSGKHNNWSMGTNTGKNLLSPSKNPIKNLSFLTFLVNVVKAVHTHADVLRASFATASNDHRLGANEAPPAIISIFLGDQLTEVLDLVENGGDTMKTRATMMDLLTKLPDMEVGSTDRNRTSPFAFTGNKFEIRAVGSTQNCGVPMAFLNAMIGTQLIEFKADLDAAMKTGKDQDTAILSVLKGYITASRAVLFEGNGYSNEWRLEAKARGLRNDATTPEALEQLVTKKTEKLFTESGVLTKKELHAYHEVQLEIYSKKVDIEAVVMTELVNAYVLPSVVEYQTKLAQNVAALRAIGVNAAAQEAIVQKIGTLTNALYNDATKLVAERDKAEKAKSAHAMAKAYCEKVMKQINAVRESADELEGLIDDKSWGLVKYREMLFLR